MAGKTTKTKAEAFLRFAKNDGASNAMIASQLGVSRQRIDVLRHEWERATATDEKPSTVDSSQIEHLAALYATEPPPATADNATTLERQRLLDLVSEDLQLEVFMDKILRGSAPRAAAIAVGITARQFSKRMESDERFRDLVLRAAHEAESSVAQNLYRLATGNSPQAAQSAIAWLNARVPDDWSPNRQKIDIEVTGGIDVRAMMASPRAQEWIEAVNKLEAELQRAEDAPQLPAYGDVIEGEVMEPRDEVRAALPDDKASRVREDRIEIVPRKNRPGQQSDSGRPHTREVVVDGIRTLVVDSNEGGGDGGADQGWTRL